MPARYTINVTPYWALHWYRIGPNWVLRAGFVRIVRNIDR